ncbi:MAG TPA: hypothetical protein VFP65_05985 [Anaeromyxobacteraceae bacterium]|nr:hypothetical protein [Anaeromyxobacteraceae bacterium]
MSLARSPLLHAVALAFAVAYALALSACGSTSPDKKPIACQVDPDCPAEAKCVLGACVAGSLPQAKIVVRATTAELVSNRLITFDGSSSEDTNPGGSVRRFAWSVSRPPGTGCDPSAAAGDRPIFSTIFGCSGVYAVELKVTNDVGLESLPQRAELTIAQALDAPVITEMGPALSAAHRCAGSPVVCRALGAADQTSFQLSVSAADRQDANLGYAWTYSAPGAVDPARTRVAFDPGPNTPTPLVRIETDGAPIAGDWVFQVQVTDSDRLVTVGRQVLTVANAPPDVAPEISAVVMPHVFLAPVDHYVATATVRASVSDADGDDVTAADVALVESSASACTFQVLSSDLAAGQYTAKVQLDCPGASASDLIGSVTRQLAVKAHDLNGGEGTSTLPLAVSNAPPILDWAGGPVAGTYTVAHGTAPCPAGASSSLCFAVAAPLPYRASDAPENDPVALTLTPSGVPAGTFMTASAAGGFTWLVPTDKPALLRTGDGASGVAFTVSAGDAFTGTAPSTGAFALAVANTPPVLALRAPARPLPHTYLPQSARFHAELDLAAVSDADGDPVTAAAASSDGACAATGVSQGMVHVACDWSTLAGAVAPARTVWASARDPWTSAADTAHTPLVVDNQPPIIGSLPASLSASANCVCNSSLCEYVVPAGGTVSFDPKIQEPDGDPVRLTVTASNGAVLVDKTCSGASCAVTFTSPTGSVTMRATDGVAFAQATYALSVSCTNTAPCRPPPGHPCL